jgi:dTDP-4-amino-4,6-dideoxygalactose transaminase
VAIYVRYGKAKGRLMKRQVPFFNYPAVIKEHESEVRDKMNDVLARGAFIGQKDLVQFEENLARFLNVKHAIGVANGTDGLIIALKAAGIRPGDEVIVPSHTFVASASSVVMTGGKPVLCECGPDHMTDPKHMASLVTNKTRFLMPVQLNGRTCDMDAIQEIAVKHKLLIIEDAAQGLGSKWKGRMAGTFGKAGMFSFYPAKVLGCFGDGGAVVTDSDEMNEKMPMIRDHGRGPSGMVETWGLNSRLDNLQAAVLDVKLKYYGDVMKRRRQLASFYQEGMGKLKEVVLPPAPNSDPNHFDIYQNYEIEAERRDDLKKYLADHGVGTLLQWGGHAIHQMPELGFEGVKLPVTERMTARFIMLPMNMSMTDEDVGYVIETIHRFYGHK